MDPLTLAFSFSTIVGLICNYRGEKNRQEDENYSDFLLWLSESNHDEIKKLIKGNTEISQGIEKLLLENRDMFLEKLEAIEEITLKISSQIPGFDSLAKAINQNLEISEQAISIISQLNKTGFSKMLEAGFDQGTSLIVFGNNLHLTIEEPRFLDDDLNTLVNFGLLLKDYNSSGSAIYSLSRNAVKFIAAHEKNSNK